MWPEWHLKNSQDFKQHSSLVPPSCNLDMSRMNPGSHVTSRSDKGNQGRPTLHPWCFMGVISHDVLNDNYTSSHNHGSEKCLPPSSSYLLNTAIFHFHDYGRKGNDMILASMQRGTQHFSLLLPMTSIFDGWGNLSFGKRNDGPKLNLNLVAVSQNQGASLFFGPMNSWLYSALFWNLVSSQKYGKLTWAFLNHSARAGFALLTPATKHFLSKEEVLWITVPFGYLHL